MVEGDELFIVFLLGLLLNDIWFLKLFNYLNLLFSCWVFVMLGSLCVKGDNGFMDIGGGELL